MYVCDIPIAVLRSNAIIMIAIKDNVSKKLI